MTIKLKKKSNTGDEILNGSILKEQKQMEKNEDVGMKIILPSTIYGAFRYALDIVRDLEKLHIFITFTCNHYMGVNNCTKNFTKSFQQCTKVTENSYPLYMLRDS